MDLYGPLLARALFPAFEAASGRPTVPLTRYLHGTERWSPGQLRDVQTGLLRRLLRHAYLHTVHYRELLDDRGLRPEDIAGPADLELLPLLDRATTRATVAARTAGAPPRATITKTTRGTTGAPVTVTYNAETRHWRDASKWRADGWAGYHIGDRAFHYRPYGPPPTFFARKRAQLDHLFKRDLYLDSGDRDLATLRAAVATLRTFQPDAIVAHTEGLAALARFVIDHRLRAWKAIPVLAGGSPVDAAERAVIEQAFGPVYETYGCRELGLVGSECAEHDGLHTAMEMMIVELVVREPHGTLRAARPGETGEVALTDLHNLACPMIRYLTGDVAIARADDACACGRGLARIGGIARAPIAVVDRAGAA